MNEKELGIVLAVIKDFADHRIPRLLQLEANISEGAKLSEPDMVYLEQCFEISKGSPEFAEKHSEYKELVYKVANLYHRITDLALKNEQG